MTRSQCKVSDTQVTVKACGPLVYPVFLTLKFGLLFKKFNLANNFLTGNSRVSIFHMNISCDKIFLLVLNLLTFTFDLFSKKN